MIYVTQNMSTFIYQFMQQIFFSINGMQNNILGCGKNTCLGVIKTLI
jgi:hypothetical protein